ncbi:MAG: hypothetical protein Q8L40_11680 [Burkholderiales bacterium]|nr:hypothetical protein [Burkholderiales bacterium]
MNKITEIAAELLAALDHGKTIPSVAERNPGFGWDEGYDIAAEIVKLRRARGEKTVGRKIGFTNRNIWPEYGATSPIWAHVYDDTLIFADWKFLPADAAADFSLHWRLIVGTPYRPRLDEITNINNMLRDCRVALLKNGRVMDRGVGANALDHPALALAFLADIVARQTQFTAPAAGEIITTGTLTAALSIKPGETWSSHYEGLSGVSGLTVQFTD